MAQASKEIFYETVEQNLAIYSPCAESSLPPVYVPPVS